MKIAFFGQRKFFDYFKIGGFESFIRRLANGLASLGNEVDYILYDAPQERVMQAAPGLRMAYCRSFDEGVTKLLTGNYDHIFRVWLDRHHRLKYLWVTRTARGRTRWHHCFLAWPDSFTKRRLAAMEGWLDAPGGYNICVSPRQFQVIKKFKKRSCLIIPPVPAEYFLTPEQKGQNDRIRVTFLGNLTPDKCIAEVITLFGDLAKHSRFRFSIWATHNPLNPDSVEINHRLRSQKEIIYHHVDMESYSPASDAMVKNVLHDTDVFVQPYRTLKNTLDTPLLLLEAMAALCAVITTPVGSVPEIYGESRFLIPGQQFSRQAEIFLRNLTYEQIIGERNRIHERNQQLNFTMASLMEKMLSILES